jgi:tetratricopeptide (TPR) repeat protein
MRKFLWILLLAMSCAIEGRPEFNAGVLAWERDDYDRAIIEFQVAIRKNDELGEAHQGLAECYVRKQMLAEAQKSYIRAKQLYDAGKFQDTPTEDEKKRLRVNEQLDWIEKALALDAKTPTSTTTAPPK